MQLATLRRKFTALQPIFTERSRRLWAATEARAIGYGGIAQVARATGLAESTIQRGLRDLRARAALPSTRNRLAGGGRKPATVTQPTLARDLDALVEPTAPGDPDSPLRWTSQSVRTLAVALEGLGHHVSHTVVADVLHALGYSLQGNVKTREGRQHPDRDAQFRYIADAVRRWQRRGQPTISVDTKKKELVGDFKNGGRVWRRKGEPNRVRVHDFVIRDPGHGKAIPYGVYDLRRDEGWVSVGIDHDTASFAVHAIRRWWRVMGRPAYRRATSLLITADAGGSNGARLRLWKWELQRLANRTGLTITVCHFPPGTSKWNKIEHRLFSHIAMNWRGTPLEALATIVSLIGSTHSRSGLRVRSELDRGRYPSGVTVTDTQMATIRLKPHRFHGEWNYTIHPTITRRERVLIS
ncbi:MAG: ISAzo13 family transposase [Myxococcaceae bacterium]|nr:MAG: ISAzo13 family transposase [Myxococcaceae bacterium]